MNKTDFIRAIAEKTNSTIKNAESFMSAFIDVTAETLQKGEEINLSGLGAFSVSERKERSARNFQTGEMMKVPACNSVKFKVGKTLKDAVKQT